MPTLSVIIPTHNRVHYLGRAIDSALVAAEGVEVIVVDDCSQDQTQRYCEGRSDIRYIRLEKNLRTAGARNVGLEMSTADHILILDDDDWLLPGMAERQLRMIEQDPECGVVYGRMAYCDSAGEMLPDDPTPLECPEGDLFEVFLRGNIIGCMTAVVRKSVFDRVGVFDTSPGMWGIEDWDMWLRIAEHYPMRSTAVPVAVYRKPGQDRLQWSSNTVEQFGRVAGAYRSKWLNLPRSKQLVASGRVDPHGLLDKVADRILFEVATLPKGRGLTAKNIAAVVKASPGKLIQAGFYKTLARSYKGSAR